MAPNRATHQFPLKLHTSINHPMLENKVCISRDETKKVNAVSSRKKVDKYDVAIFGG